MSTVVPSPPPPKYWAFVSYSSKDREWGKWLIDALESYRVPKSLVGLKTGCGVVPRRLYPVFRDRDELRVGSDVGEALHGALAVSRYLIVICSPNSADPRSWVGKEVASFKARGREQDVLALIVDGEAPDCFPSPLRHRFDENGRETGLPADPLAADVQREDDRPRAARRKALLKIIARMIDVDFDTLVQRDRGRRRQRAAALVVSGAAILGVTVLLAVLGLRESRRSLSQQLAMQARTQASEKPDLSLLLGVLSYRIAPTPASLESILSTLWPRENLVGYLRHADEAPGTGRGVSSIAFDHEDANVVLATCKDETCRTSLLTRYDLDGLHPRLNPIEVPGEVTALHFRKPDGRILVASNRPDSCDLLEIDPGTRTRAPSRIYHGSDPITAMQVNEDGRYYALGFKSGEFKVFDRERGERRCGGKLEGPVDAMAFSNDGRKLAAVKEGAATVVDLTTASCRATSSPMGQMVLAAAFDPGGSELYVVAPDGTLSRWRLGDLGDAHSMGPRGAPTVFGHALDPQARYLAYRYDSEVKVYNLEKMREHENDPASRPDSGTLPNTNRVQQDMTDFEVLQLPDGEAEQVVFSSSGKLLVVADKQGNATLWSISPRPLVDSAEVDEIEGEPELEASSPDGKFHATVGERRIDCPPEGGIDCKSRTELRLTDVASGFEVARLYGPRGPAIGARQEGPMTVAFQADGRVVTRHGWLREVWNVAPGELLERACRMANRELTPPEMERYLPVQQRILGIEQPCERQSVSR